MTTLQHKIHFLKSFGFTVGDRNPDLNTDFQGAKMVVEATVDDIGDYDLPTADGSDGPWCVVGDDLNDLVDRAMDDYLLSLADSHNQIAEKWEAVQKLPLDELDGAEGPVWEKAPAAPAPTAP
jgi:hypothetical protein